MGYFPGKQTATPKASSSSTSSGGSSSSSSKTPYKTSPALTSEENAARMAANTAAGVGDQYGRSPSDPNYGTAPKAPSDQFRTGGGAALVSQSVPVQRQTREQMIYGLAYQQKVSQEARAYAQQTYTEVMSSKARRIEREAAEREAAKVNQVRPEPQPNNAVFSSNASSPTTKTDLGTELPFIGIAKGPIGTIGLSTFNKDKLEPQLTDTKEYLLQQQLKKDNKIQKVIDTASYNTAKNVPYAFRESTNPFISSVAVPFIVGATTTTATILGHPVQTVKGLFTSITNPVKTVKQAQTAFGEMTATKGEVYTISQVGGSVVASAAIFKAAEGTLKLSPVKAEYETTTIQTKGGGSVTTKSIGVKAGPYGKTIGSRTTVKPAVQDLTTGQYLKDTTAAPMSAEYTSWNIGQPKLAQKVPPSELAGSVAQPVTASGGKALQGVIDLTAQETTRLQSNVNVAYLLGKEKGLPVKEFVVNIDGVKNPATATKIIERYSGKEGTLFGSVTTKQLPGQKTGGYTIKYLNYLDDGKPISVSSYQNLKQGDIDLIFPSKTVAQIQSELPGVVKQLRAAGENVEISPGTNIIQFVGSKDKFLEVKSGIDQASLGLGDQAPAGYLGVKFPDLKKGQAPSNVKFGETYAIRAGEQLQRKGAGSVIISPGDAGETAAFSQAGILGKQGNPRGLKDTAGFLQQSTGIIEKRSTSLNPVTRLTTNLAKTELDKWLSSYTPSQQADIVAKLKTTTGSIELTPTRVSQPGLGFLQENTALTVETVAAEYQALKSFAKEEPSAFKSLKSAESSPYSKVSSVSSSPSPSVTGSPSISYSPISSIPSVFKSVSPSSSSSSLPSPYISPSMSLGSSYSVSSSPSPSTVSSPSPSRSSSSPSSSPSPSVSLSPSPSLSASPSPSIVYSPSPSPPGSPSPKPPPQSPTKTIISPFMSSKNKEPKQAYDVFVRTEGTFKRIATTDTLGRAFNAGRIRVVNTSAASFKVRAVGKPESSTLRGRKYVPQKSFYESKKEPGVFIQKRSFRIGTAGEKREITYKGIAASRGSTKNKKIFGVF